MSRGLVIGIVVVAVIVIGGALVISLRNVPDTGQTAEPNAAQATPLGAGEGATLAATPEPQAVAAPAQGGELNAETIVGTEWQYDAYKFKFEPDGKLVVNGVIPGTWTVEGDTLTAAALGTTVEGKLKGDQLLIKDKPARRIELGVSSVADQNASSQSGENEEGGR